MQAPAAQPPALAANHDWADLMSRVNHELRTPLNAVIGFSEMMALEMFGPLGNDRYQEYVRYIRDSADELLKSAEDTLALTALLTNAASPPMRPSPARSSMPSPTPGLSSSARPPAATFNSSLTLPEDVEVIGRAARAAADPRQHAVRGRLARRPRRPRRASSPLPTAS